MEVYITFRSSFNDGEAHIEACLSKIESRYLPPLRGEVDTIVIIQRECLVAIYGLFAMTFTYVS
jgi:hypothetical protein